MGARMLKISPKTTDPDVNYNRQLKIFYNRIIEEGFYQNKLGQLTTREGIINIHSLIHNQIFSPKYVDMIRYAWHGTDPDFNVTELSKFPPAMVNKNQFEFDPAEKCHAMGCNQHAFVRCSHCGKLLCLQHFIERLCFHNSHIKPRSIGTCPANLRHKRDVNVDCPSHDSECQMGPAEGEIAAEPPSINSATERNEGFLSSLHELNKLGATSLIGLGITTWIENNKQQAAPIESTITTIASGATVVPSPEDFGSQVDSTSTRRPRQSTVRPSPSDQSTKPKPPRGRVSRPFRPLSRLPSLGRGS